jgi:hypothetical protein
MLTLLPHNKPSTYQRAYHGVITFPLQNKKQAHKAITLFDW